MASKPDTHELLARVAELEGENALLKSESEAAAEANVRAAMRLLEISEQRKRELAIQKDNLEGALRAAGEANRLKDEFLAMVSHELRTPMNGILGTLSLIEPESLGSSDRENITTAVRSGRALLSLIEDLLDFSRIHTAQLECEPTRTNLLEAVETAAVIAAEGRRQAVDFGVFWPGELPRYGLTDGHRVRQVLGNLLSNAFKFTESGCVALHVERREDGEGIRFVVADSGCGIESEYLPKIFDPFTQADLFRTRRAGGTGLGLAISHEIVTALGGTIRIDTKVGEGTKVFVDLPIAVVDNSAAAPSRHGRVACIVESELEWQCLLAHYSACGMLVDRLARLDAVSQHDLVVVDPGALAPDDASLLELDTSLTQVVVISPSTSTEATAGSSMIEAETLSDGVRTIDRPLLPSKLWQLVEHHSRSARKRDESDALGLAKRRVLIVEDNVINQKVLQRMVERCGCVATIASDGVEALDRAFAEAFDAVLMDCQMPRLDGYSATRELRRTQGPNATVPIIAVTANAMPADRVRCTEAGMDDFLAKPVELGQLEACLARHLSPVA